MIIYNLIMSTYMVHVGMRVKIAHKRKRICVTALGELLVVKLIIYKKNADDNAFRSLEVKFLTIVK